MDVSNIKKAEIKRTEKAKADYIMYGVIFLTVAIMKKTVTITVMAVVE